MRAAKSLQTDTLGLWVVPQLRHYRTLGALDAAAYNMAHKPLLNGERVAALFAYLNDAFPM